jgi:hypothetical protein
MALNFIETEDVTLRSCKVPLTGRFFFLVQVTTRLIPRVTLRLLPQFHLTSRTENCKFG